MGRSGAGKSTVAALLSRFYDPTSGVLQPAYHCWAESKRQLLTSPVDLPFELIQLCRHNAEVRESCLVQGPYTLGASQPPTSLGGSGRGLWLWCHRSLCCLLVRDQCHRGATMRAAPPERTPCTTQQRSCALCWAKLGASSPCSCRPARSDCQRGPAVHACLVMAP